MDNSSSKPVTYVHEVPAHCDRIIWRGSYYHLENMQGSGGEAVSEEPVIVTPQMTQREFRAVLDWFMSSDPFPADADTHAVCGEWIDRTAKADGWDSWIDAFHRVPR